jgi:hypothetical protein
MACTSGIPPIFHMGVMPGNPTLDGWASACYSLEPGALILRGITQTFPHASGRITHAGMGDSAQAPRHAGVKNEAE